MAALGLLHDGQQKQEFLTGLIYVEPSKKDFLSLLDLPERPLAVIADEKVRPSRESLDQMMEELK
jgi:2-oxoglutarate ferredoxin oxidoreductase subunit beta